MLLAADVMRLVSGALQDLEPDMERRWPWTGGENDRVGLLDYLNAALRAVALQRPDCRAVTEAIKLEAGMRQSIPRKTPHGASYDAVGFCELTRNMGSNGKTPGKTILSVRQDILMAWILTEKTSSQIDNFAYDRSTNPKIFYVWPAVPANANVYVEATYYAQPDVITSAEQEIDIAEGYTQALAHHMLANILAADNSSSGLAKAQYHQQLYQQAMDIKLQVDYALPKAKNSVSIRGA